MKLRADSLAEHLIARSDSTLRTIEPLSRREEERLRRFVQNDHLEYARRRGIEPVRNRRLAGELMSLPSDRSGVVRLRTNDFYIVDPRMGFAVPLVVPPAAHVVDRIGRRFQADLLARGLPPYRFILTNILRTGTDQAHLRASNINAAQGESTHEYGTTFDIYYGRFHYASARDSLVRLASRRADLDEAHFRQRLRQAYRRFGKAHAASMKAVLGRTLLQLQEEGLILVTYERQQPVFHVTVARDLEAPPPGGYPHLSAEAAAMRRFYANVESQLTDVDNDIDDLEEQASEAAGDRKERLEQSLSLLEEMQGGLWRELDRIDGFPGSEVPTVRRRLQRTIAELEGRLERTRLESMESRQDVQSRLATRLRQMDRTLSQLEAQVEHAPRDVEAAHEVQVADLRSRYGGLRSYLQQLEGTSGTEFENARSAAAEALARLLADLEVVAAGVNEIGE